MKASCMPRKIHPKCRPPSVHKPMMQLRDDHRWVRASGAPGLAFVVAEDDDTATVYVAHCKCVDYLNCPVSRALAYGAERFGAATVVRRPATRLLPKQDKIRRPRTRR